MTDFCVKICSSLIASPISTELETTEKFLPTVRIHVVLCFESLALLLKSAYCRTELEHNDCFGEFLSKKYLRPFSIFSNIEYQNWKK